MRPVANPVAKSKKQQKGLASARDSRRKSSRTTRPSRRPPTSCRSGPDGAVISAFARAAVLAILRQHSLWKADAGAIVDKDDRAALGAFLSGRTDDIDIVPIEDLAHVLGLTVSELIGDAQPTSVH
jgi:hypothetical protein